MHRRLSLTGVAGVVMVAVMLNLSYLDLATHYDLAVMPARVRKPKDKAKAEAGVQLVQRSDTGRT